MISRTTGRRSGRRSRFTTKAPGWARRSIPTACTRSRGELDAAGVYLGEEVERFCAVYFKPKLRQSSADHKVMNAALDPAVSRFAALQRDKEEDAELLRGKMQAFRNLYGFLSQIIPYQDFGP